MQGGWVALVLFALTTLCCRAQTDEWQLSVNDTALDDSATAGHNCSRCVVHEEAREMRIEAIKVQILSKLRMTHAPNTTRKTIPSIPPLHLLLDRYGMQADSSSFVPGPEYEEETEDPYHLFAEKVISFAQEPPHGHGFIHEDQTLYFKFSRSLYSSYVAKAHLWIYVKPNSHIQESTTAWIVVYQVSRTDRTKEHNLLTISNKKVEMKPHKGFWVEIDMRKVVARWFHRPESNLGLVVHSYDQQGQRELLVLDPKDGANQVPFIEVRVETSRRRRNKRMIGLNCEDNSSEVRCCRYPLTVDFEEFGWDWIIAPKRYEANYCSGECPYVFLQKYPHTHLVQQANPQGSAGPCCAPRKMSAISMLYSDEEQNIVYGLLPGMVVDRCGCL